MNALKHGLLSKEIVLPTENDADLLELEKRLRSSFLPVGELEHALVDRIVSSLWRIRRALAVERATMQHEHQDAGRFSMRSVTEEERVKAMLFGAEMDRIIRYENALERSLYRALHELQRLQAARNGERPPAPVVVDLETV